MNEKLKSFLLNDQIFYGIIVILVALASFGLGRASVVEKGQNLIENEVVTESVPAAALSVSAVPLKTAAAPTATAVPPATTAGNLVGSKSGTKYHLTTCPGAKQIKEENKVYFASVVEAEAAGYKPAANCPQLQ
jgi:hypothetical protein